MNDPIVPGGRGPGGQADARKPGGRQQPGAAPMDDAAAVLARQRAGRTRLLILFALFCLPVVASYLAYYVFPTDRRSNYGTLIEPQRDLPDAQAVDLQGRPAALSSLRGRWVLLTVDHADCSRDCAGKLWAMRQVRLTTGKDRDRVERAWLVADDAPVDPRLLAEYEGTFVARVDPARLTAALPTDAGTSLSDHIWVVDPLGHVMMRFPRQADPNRMKKDLAKLLRVSRIG